MPGFEGRMQQQRKPGVRRVDERSESTRAVGGFAALIRPYSEEIPRRFVGVVVIESVIGVVPIRDNDNDNDPRRSRNSGAVALGATVNKG